MHPTRIKLYETTCMREEALMNDMIMGSWKSQPHQFIEREIVNSMSRLEVETTSFYLGFMTPIEPEKMGRLMKKPHQMNSQERQNPESNQMNHLPYGIYMWRFTPQKIFRK